MQRAMIFNIASSGPDMQPALWWMGRESHPAIDLRRTNDARAKMLTRAGSALGSRLVIPEGSEWC